MGTEEEFRAHFEEVQVRLLELMMGKPRFKRGYQGRVTPIDLQFVGRFQGENKMTYVSDVEELIPGEGETPESDLFLRDFEILGTRRGTSLVDVLLHVAPLVAPGSAGWLDIFGKILRK